MTYKEWTKPKIKLPAGARGKSKEKYLRRLYKANKEKIDELFEVRRRTALYGSGNNKNPEDWFVNLLNYGIKDDDDWAHEARKWGNTNAFTSPEDRLLRTNVDKLRNNPVAWHQFRMAIGWDTPIDYSLFKGEGYGTTTYEFSYGNLVHISYDISMNLFTVVKL